MKCSGVSWIGNHPCVWFALTLVLFFAVIAGSFFTSFIFTINSPKELYPDVSNDFSLDYMDDYDTEHQEKTLDYKQTSTGTPIQRHNAGFQVQRVRTTSAPITADIFNGYYEHKKDKNFDDVLAALGVGFFLRETIRLSSPNVEVITDLHKWTILTHLPIMTLNYTFALGEEVTLRGPQGSNRFVFALDKNVLIQEPLDDDYRLRITRIFLKKKMITKLHHETSNTNGINYYKKRGT